MISVIIQHGVRFGVIVSAVCSSIILCIDLITSSTKPNPSFQIDLILVGAYLTIAWLVGYYRSVEEQYSLKMANLAKRDDLTGLYSHGYFQLSLTEQIKDAKENNQELSLLFLDIDYFKYFNDLFGHQEGDEVLKGIGAIIEKSIKPPQIAARYGGEEFTVIMNDTSEAEAVSFAEKLRQDIEVTYFGKFDGISKITVSIGVSCYPTRAKSKDELLKYADDALYRAKSFHRNRVETYQSVLEELKNEIEDDDLEIVSTVKTLISIINSKDKYTYRHVERVVIFCGLIADELNLSEYDKKILKYGAYLHDIGKIDIPQEVLNKKMKLTNDEWELLKQHPKYGVDIINNVKSLSNTIPIILYHHEKYDGSGYPENLKGEEIPYLARILTVADSFDAMTSNRPYSIAKTFDEGIQELVACSSFHFDPEIVNVFSEILKKKKDLF
jgi:diguanylate cyclase (GGDEF)-like protein/putative nucleotidyltransferase with HDIG domain